MQLLLWTTVLIYNSYYAGDANNSNLIYRRACVCVCVCVSLANSVLFENG